MLFIVQIDILKHKIPGMCTLTGLPLQVHHKQIFDFYYLLMKNETITIMYLNEIYYEILNELIYRLNFCSKIFETTLGY